MHISHQFLLPWRYIEVDKCGIWNVCWEGIRIILITTYSNFICAWIIDEKYGHEQLLSIPFLSFEIVCCEEFTKLGINSCDGPNIVASFIISLTDRNLYKVDIIREYERIYSGHNIREEFISFDEMLLDFTNNELTTTEGSMLEERMNSMFHYKITPVIELPFLSLALKFLLNPHTSSGCIIAADDCSQIVIVDFISDECVVRQVRNSMPMVHIRMILNFSSSQTSASTATTSKTVNESDGSDVSLDQKYEFLSRLFCVTDRYPTFSATSPPIILMGSESGHVGWFPLLPPTTPSDTDTRTRLPVSYFSQHHSAIRCMGIIDVRSPSSFPVSAPDRESGSQGYLHSLRFYVLETSGNLSIFGLRHSQTMFDDSNSGGVGYSMRIVTEHLHFPIPPSSSSQVIQIQGSNSFVFLREHQLFGCSVVLLNNRDENRYLAVTSPSCLFPVSSVPIVGFSIIHQSQRPSLVTMQSSGMISLCKIDDDRSAFLFGSRDGAGNTPDSLSSSSATTTAPPVRVNGAADGSSVSTVGQLTDQICLATRAAQCLPKILALLETKTLRVVSLISWLQALEPAPHSIIRPVTRATNLRDALRTSCVLRRQVTSKSRRGGPEEVVLEISLETGDRTIALGLDGACLGISWYSPQSIGSSSVRQGLATAISVPVEMSSSSGRNPDNTVGQTTYHFSETIEIPYPDMVNYRLDLQLLVSFVDVPLSRIRSNLGNSYYPVNVAIPLYSRQYTAWDISTSLHRPPSAERSLRSLATSRPGPIGDNSQLTIYFTDDPISPDAVGPRWIGPTASSPVVKELLRWGDAEGQDTDTAESPLKPAWVALPTDPLKGSSQMSGYPHPGPISVRIASPANDEPDAKNKNKKLQYRFTHGDNPPPPTRPEKETVQRMVVVSEDRALLALLHRQVMEGLIAELTEGGEDSNYYLNYDEVADWNPTDKYLLPDSAKKVYHEVKALEREIEALSEDVQGPNNTFDLSCGMVDRIWMAYTAYRNIGL